MSSLSHLDLSYNQLSGVIPAELSSLSRLGWLDLSNNQLSGVIPAELSNLSNLDWLNLTQNPDLRCWETEEAQSWALSIEYCTVEDKHTYCEPGYLGPTEVCHP